MEFNNLNARRDACEAYQSARRGLGPALREHYDDGGFSGGTLDRPALKQLNADIDDGLVDVVVVYKIDRLGRALMGFSKPVEIFDRHGVTFVSVTQSFNTTPLMGRLTLNILPSFARFEREVMANNRDKVAASKKKGMWMGRYVPLGYDYDAVDRKLIVNEAEAASVRRIFERFIELGSATVLARELRRDGFRNKQGTLIDKGYLYRLLNNRVYRGEARARNDPRPHSARTSQTRPSPPHSAAEACRGRHGPRTQPASVARHRPGLGMAAADGARRGRRHRRSRRRARHLRPPSCAALKGQHPGPEPLRSTTVGCTRIHSRQNAGSKIKR